MKKMIIEGIKCEGCINRIKKVLENIKEIKKYEITANNELLCEVKNDKVIEEIVSKIEALDFKVSLEK